MWLCSGVVCCLGREARCSCAVRLPSSLCFFCLRPRDRGKSADGAALKAASSARKKGRKGKWCESVV